jgi:hypothetical protein
MATVSCGCDGKSDAAQADLGGPVLQSHRGACNPANERMPKRYTPSRSSPRGSRPLGQPTIREQRVTNLRKGLTIDRYRE